MKKTFAFFAYSIFLMACDKMPDHAPSGVKIGELSNSKTFMDTRDSSEYAFVSINGLDWMASNLHYAYGNVRVPSIDGQNYSSDLANVVQNGYLYNSSSVLSTTALCPNGWRIPTLAEMDAMLLSLGGAAIAGDKLKSSTLWTAAIAASNSSKLNFVPAGYITEYYSSGYYYPTYYGYGSMSRIWLKSGSDLYLSNLISGTDEVTTSSVTPDEHAYYSCRCVRASTDTNTVPVTGDTMTDNRDGKKYSVVTIGTQKWMGQNLKYSGASCIAYGNDNGNIATYGYLYPQDIVLIAPPTGWHIPTQTDIDILIQYLGGSSIAGGKLKSTSSWTPPNQADNSSGFSFLPGGIGSFLGPDIFFNGLGTSGGFGYFDASSNWVVLMLQNNNTSASSSGIGNNFYCSVRYVKN